MEAHAPTIGLSDMSVRLYTSTNRGTSSRGQSSSCATVDTFQSHGGEDKDKDEDKDEEERGYEWLGPSQL